MANSKNLIALGANLPSGAQSPAQTLLRALAALPGEGLALRAVSRFYRSPAFPPGSGPEYVNACAVVEGALSPSEVLQALHRVEAALGRERKKRWGARGIDLDLLAVDALVLPDVATQTHWRNLTLEAQMRDAPDELVLPHPRLSERAFVLIPLAEIAPSWRHPLTGRSVAAMLAQLPAAEKAALTAFSAPEGRG